MEVLVGNKQLACRMSAWPPTVPPFSLEPFGRQFWSETEADLVTPERNRRHIISPSTGGMAIRKMHLIISAQPYAWAFASLYLTS